MLAPKKFFAKRPVENGGKLKFYDNEKLYFKYLVA